MIIFKNTGAVFRGMGIIMILVSYLIPVAMPKFVLAGLSLLLSGYLSDKVFDEGENASGSANTEIAQKKNK